MASGKRAEEKVCSVTEGSEDRVISFLSYGLNLGLRLLFSDRSLARGCVVTGRDGCSDGNAGFVVGDTEMAPKSVVICVVPLRVYDHGDGWPVPYRHQNFVTSDLIPKPSHSHSDRDQNCLPVHQTWSRDISFNER
jgi:hypothetical protein